MTNAAVRPVLPIWVALPAAAGAGFLMDLAFPAVGWWPVAFPSVALALLSLVGRGVRGSLATGTAFGATFMFSHLVWVAEFLGPLPWFALAGLESLLIGLGAIPIALTYRWTRRLRRRPWIELALVPNLIALLWTGRELALGVWPYSGFPWARLGMAFADSPLADGASWVGVTGLSFAAAWCAAWVVQWAHRRPLRTLITSIPPVALVTAMAALPQASTEVVGTMRIGWVQGNGPSGYFDDREAGDILAAQRAATAPLLGQDLDLLVWPEGSVDSDPFRSAATGDVLRELSASVDAPLLVNAATARGESVFNTSSVWGADGSTGQLHDKVNPVPFGEYVPDRWFYELLAPDLVGLIQREYTPGSNTPAIRVGERTLGLAICFDVIYDDVIRRGISDGAQVLVFQTNNADFRGTDENLQQIAFARMRAIETGRAVVNVSTVGTSQVIDASGRVIDELGVDRAGARVTTVELREGRTPAMIAGPVITLIIAIGAATTAVSAVGATMIAAIRRRRQA